MSLRLARLAAWSLVAAIAFVTLGPLRDRPSLSTDPQSERFLAYLSLGFVFAIAYPRHRAAVVVGVVGCALGLELGQRLTPNRHGELRDATAKALGGVIGALAVECAQRFARAEPSLAPRA